MRPDIEPSGEPPRAYRWLVVGMLATAYMLNFLDRQIISVLAEPIRKDLHLSDTQLGLVGGIVFAAFYTAFGIPVGALADRTRRVWIVAAACSLWSLFTALCGIAQGFVQLALFRMGVGIGEAGGSAPSYALISDYFRPHERGTAFAIFSLGVPVGSMFGSALGGWIASAHGWRVAFFAIGAPGVVLALLLLLFVREPVRGRFDPVETRDAAGTRAPSIAGSIRAFLADRTLVLTALASGVSGLVAYAGLAWFPPYLMRVKQMSLNEIAAYYSLTIGLTGIVGMVATGWLADRLALLDRRWLGWLPAIGYALILPFWAAFLLAPGWPLALMFLAVPGLLYNTFLAPAIAIVQGGVEPARRAVSGAMLLFFMNIVGLGIGPVYVGRVSDLARPAFGDASLTIGLAAVLPLIVVAACLHLAVARAIGRERRAAPPPTAGDRNMSVM